LVILKKELFQQNHDTGEINECGKARKQLVIPCSDMPEILQLLKEAVSIIHIGQFNAHIKSRRR